MRTILLLLVLALLPAALRAQQATATTPVAAAGEFDAGTAFVITAIGPASLPIGSPRMGSPFTEAPAGATAAVLASSRPQPPTMAATQTSDTPVDTRTAETVMRPFIRVQR